jgi:beta-glucosidase
MGNVIQSFIGPDGHHLGPTCGLSWVEVGKICQIFHVLAHLSLTYSPVPWGFRNILKWIHERYHYPIYVTESGMCCLGEAQKSLPDVLDDQARIDYHCSYLDAMKDAILEDGVDVRSYFAWSLMDNWEWADGFSTMFGVTYVEKDDNGRVLQYWPKNSSRAITKWFEENYTAVTAGV